MAREAQAAPVPSVPTAAAWDAAEPRPAHPARAALERRLPTSLASRFLLANLGILLVGGLIIGVWVGDQVERAIVDRTASITALYVESSIAPSSASVSADGRLDPAAAHQLDTLLGETALGKRIVSLRLWAPDGTIIYGQVPGLIGQRFAVAGHRADAWAGRLGAEMSNLAGPENAFERARWSHLLEINLPIRERGGDRIIAVADFFQLPDEIDREVADARLRSWAAIAAAMAVSAMLLYGIVKRGSDTITRQETALTRQVGELTGLLRQNEALTERLRTAAERGTTINERALRRISADLHDGPGQMLSLALMRLDGLRAGSAAGHHPGAAELEEVEGALQDAMKDMRAIAAGLRLPDLAPLTIEDLAARVVGDHERRTRTHVDLVLDAVPATVPLPVKITFARALQELLSNAARHGGGISVRVSVGVVDRALSLEVADGGPGFDPDRLAESSGLGLPGMREQAELLGGGFEVHSTPGQGTVVRVWWSLHAAGSGQGTARP
jgi:signal transduction histidine kinase